MAHQLPGDSDLQLIYEAPTRPLVSLSELFLNSCDKRMISLLDQLCKRMFLKICGLAFGCLAHFFFGLRFVFVSTISDPSKFCTVGRDFYCCMHTINNSMRQQENNAQRSLFHHFKSCAVLWQQSNSERNIKETILNVSK